MTLLAAAVALGVAATPRCGAQVRTSFVSIDQEDQATADADERLRQLLEGKLGEPLSPSSLSYGEAINRLSDGDAREPYLARVTPYVYLAAEMLGADLEVLGTYVSKATKGTTYRSYFVVNRAFVDSTLELGGKRPDLDDLRELIRRRAEAGYPVRFIYHNRFSTSSYFLPALYFRHHNIFSMRASTPSLTAIDSRPFPGDSSTLLVQQVAAGEEAAPDQQAGLAAVWDGTRVKFEKDGDKATLGGQVYFLELPTALPNDLLVCSRSLPQLRDGGPDAKKKLLDRLFGNRRDQPITVGLGDFAKWLPMDADAAYALGSLRSLAAEQRTPLTVRMDVGKRSPVPASYVKAAQRALRLSGTELVAYDETYHRRVDYDWTLSLVRDGYLQLVSNIPAFGTEQTFSISFRPAPESEELDLTQRLANLVASRLHRVRYVWPYDEERPLVIRDLPFAPDSIVKVQKVRWTDPVRNGYTDEAAPRRVAVESADLFKFRLAKEGFRLAMGDGNGVTPLDPMSTFAYRVVLQRPQEPRAMYAFFNGVFVLFLLVAVAGTVLALRGARRVARAAVVSPAALPDAAH